MVKASVLFALGLFSSVEGWGAKSNIDPVSAAHPTEIHHSIAPPLDQSQQVYWNFGGSTVMTTKAIKLTPDTQDTKGWVWNEYPIESENWEVEFKMKIYSKPHFGGDGMAFWVLTGDHDPTFSSEPDALNGPVFGMKEDFTGFGVVFDVYDNDNKRNNPAVYVIKNFNDDEDVKWDNDNDYAANMVTDQLLSKPGKPSTDHTCQIDVRNLGRDARILVKYLHKVLHVYINTEDGGGWKFCLSVTLEKMSFLEHHFAFTAATGQVADNHEITSITTRYLAEDDVDVDDDLIVHVGRRNTSGGMSGGAMHWLIFLLGTALLGVGGYQVVVFNGNKKYPAQCAKALNGILIPHWGVHLFLSFLLLFRNRFWGFLFNLPLVVWRGTMMSNGKHTHTDQTISGYGFKGHGSGGITTANRLYIDLASYFLLFIYYVYTTFFGGHW